MPTYGNHGNCSSEVNEVSIILNSKISSYMANYSARVTVVRSCYAFRIKCMCNGTFGTYVYIITGLKTIIPFLFVGVAVCP